jgi:hypothetical protein
MPFGYARLALWIRLRHDDRSSGDCLPGIRGLVHGWRPWEKTTLAALWLVPIVTHGVASATFIPLGVIIMIAVYVAILRRAAKELREPRRAPAAATP